MKHRLHILFEGDAPADEGERAGIIANPDVLAARLALSNALSAAGLRHTVSVRTIRHPQSKREAIKLAAE